MFSNVVRTFSLINRGTEQGCADFFVVEKSGTRITNRRAQNGREPECEARKRK